MSTSYIVAIVTGQLKHFQFVPCSFETAGDVHWFAAHWPIPTSRQQGSSQTSNTPCNHSTTLLPHLKNHATHKTY